MSLLIISDQPDFSRTIVGRWQMERTVPDFTVVSTTVWRGTTTQVELAVLAPEPLTRLLPLLELLDAGSTPTLCVVEDNAVAHTVREKYPRVLVVRQHEGWPDAVVLVAHEILRRVEAVQRAREAEAAAAAAQHDAVLGRYMLESRHGLNNALTSVLGNAELLLLEPGAVTAEVRDQIATIHCMALRMHEVLQRFSSLEAELRCSSKQSQREIQPACAPSKCAS